jgi:predicted Zn-dependent protease
MNMKRFLYLSGLILIGVLGCVTNPITGESQFNIVSQSSLLSMAKQAVPQQFAADHGVMADPSMNAYVQRVGQKLLATLKPSDMVYQNMPFSFQVVNATYVNAYAFPDGSIAVTRGMMLELENEAQLAALLGHEIAHVNCGHTASAMSKGNVLDMVVGGTGAYLSSKESSWAEAATLAGQIGGTALLASYSRDQERQADQGGMDYMVRAGYNPKGMIDLMKLLVRISGSNPSLLEQMFATHPMSAERLERATARVQSHYANIQGQDGTKEYSAAVASLRAKKPAINAFAKAESQLASKQAPAALQSVQKGLALLPNDPAGTMILADIYAASGQTALAKQAATAALNTAASLRAESMLAQCALQQKEYATALQHLNRLESRGSTDPRVSFYKGVAYEGLNRKTEALQHYNRYLTKSAASSSEGAYARQRVQQLAPAPQKEK